MTEEDVVRAHGASSKHKDEILRSTACGCFYCLASFAPTAIRKWIDEQDGRFTAECPRCGIDSVIGSSSGFPITREFLAAMREHWFRPL